MTSTCRYEICRNSAMRNAAAPSVGGDRIAPMPAAERIAPPTSGGYPARRSSGHATDPSITVVATPLPETVPSRNPASVTVRPGAAPDRDCPIDRHRPVDEEGARAGLLEHRAVDREEDDVGRRDVERHAEHAFERHVERADQTIDRIAAMREQWKADAIEPGPDQRVDEEDGRRHGQDPADGAARGFEHQDDGQCAEHDVDGERIGGAIDEALEIDERPGERGDSRTCEDPVERADSRRSRPSSGRDFAFSLRRPAPPVAAQSGRHEKKRQHQRDEQEADAVDLGLDDEEHPVERVQRQRDRQGRRQASGNAGQLPDRGLVWRRYCVVPFSRYQRSAPG